MINHSLVFVKKRVKRPEWQAAGMALTIDRLKTFLEEKLGQQIVTQYMETPRE